MLATVLGGKPWLAIDVIMIGCIPLAGLSAFLAARRVTGSVLARVWAAAAYALLPVGMGAVAGGRFGSAVVFALIPLIAVLAARIFTEAPAARPPRRLGGRAGHRDSSRLRAADLGRGRPRPPCSRPWSSAGRAGARCST